MALKSEQVQIGDWPMEITQLPAMRSLTMFTRLVKAFGPALAQFGGGTGIENILDSKVEDLNLGEVVEVFCTNLDEQQLDAFVREFAAHTTVEMGKGKHPDLKEVLDVVFAGRLDDLFAWLGHSLRINYRSFLDSGRLSAALALMRKGSEAGDSPEKSQKK